MSISMVKVQTSEAFLNKDVAVGGWDDCSAVV